MPRKSPSARKPFRGLISFPSHWRKARISWKSQAPLHDLLYHTLSSVESRIQSEVERKQRVSKKGTLKPVREKRVVESFETLVSLSMELGSKGNVSAQHILQGLNALRKNGFLDEKEWNLLSQAIRLAASREARKK